MTRRRLTLQDSNPDGKSTVHYSHSPPRSGRMEWYVASTTQMHLRKDLKVAIAPKIMHSQIYEKTLTVLKARMEEK